jgi:hypothetical protein
MREGSHRCSSSPFPLRTLRPREGYTPERRGPANPRLGHIHVANKDLRRCRARSAGRFEKSAQIEPACVSDMGGHYAARTERMDLLD